MKILLLRWFEDGNTNVSDVDEVLEDSTTTQILKHVDEDNVDDSGIRQKHENRT